MTFRHSIIQPMRIAIGTFLGAGALLVGLQQLGAQSIASHDSRAPVNYAADRIELQERQDRVMLSGNVDITQAGLRVRAARVTVAYSREGELKIQRIDATGGVLITRGAESARGDVAIYDFNRRIITMVGNVSLQRSGDTLNGGRLVIDLDSGVSSIDGSAAGSAGGNRVSGSFAAPKKN